MSDVPNLYGRRFAEELHDSPGQCYEYDIEPWRDGPLPHELPTSEVIEEWSAETLRSHIFAADEILDRIVEEASENGEITEGGYDSLAEAARHPEVIAAFDNALDTLIAHAPYRMADKHLRDLVVTWDENRQPLLDGEPMYVKRREIPGQEAMFE